MTEGFNDHKDLVRSFFFFFSSNMPSNYITKKNLIRSLRDSNTKLEKKFQTNVFWCEI